MANGLGLHHMLVDTYVNAVTEQSIAYAHDELTEGVRTHLNDGAVSD